jgi:uncharacterized membrane protein (UPF0127 family)
LILQAGSNSVTMTAMKYPASPDSGRRWGRALFAALVLAAGCAGAQSPQLENLASFPQGKLEIAVGKSKLIFQIWVADTPQRQAQGLMFVRSLPAQRGMLFVHESPKPIGMWMKNTYIALDMVFIDEKARIQQIVANTTPHSLDVIRSNHPALAVLEIAGGEAQRLGLKPGQPVSHPSLPDH